MRLKKYAVKKRITVGCLALMMGLSAPAFTPAVSTVYADDTNKNNNNDKNDNTDKKRFINGDDVVAMARSYVNKLPYGGGKSLETSVDCAWFVGRIYEKFGVNIYMYTYRYGYSSLSAYLFYQGKDIGTYIGTDPRLAQAGDIIVTLGHVAIATGTGTAVSALLQGVREHPVQDGDPNHYFGGYNGVFKIYRPFNVKATGVYNDPMKGMYQGEDYSAVFNFNYYYAKYPNLATKFGKLTANSSQDEKNRVATDCLKYFVEEGMAKGEQASEDFNVEIYRSNYPGLDKVFGDNLVGYYKHYIQYGAKENRNAKTSLKATTVLNGVDYSPVYNFDYYRNKYSDISKAFGMDDVATLKHFVEYGMKEGRQGSDKFNLSLYKRNYPELAETCGNDNAKYYMDYLTNGIAANRNATSILKATTVLDGVDYSAVYDYDYYQKKYPALKSAFGNDDIATLRHFVQYGMKEGRRASEEFDLETYKKNYSVLVKKYGNNNEKYYMDYIESGKKFGRNASSKNAVSVYNGVDYSAVYDFKFYQNKYADIKNAFGDNEEATLAHFVKYGMKEGRQGTAAFDVTSYRNAYSGLRNAFGDNKESYYIHYINYGQYENRIASGVQTVANPQTKATITINGQNRGVDFSPVYDYNYYVNKYPNLKAAFANDDVAALNHFIKYGMREGRQAKETFNLKAYQGRYAALRNAFGVSPEDNYKYYIHFIDYGLKEGRKATSD